MFGYVRPLKCELKLREWEYFRAVYCGLCHTLARRYGFWARYLLNYDFTVLALALAAYEPPGEAASGRCPVHPLRKRPCRGDGESAALAADLTILLSAARLRDQADDEPFFRGLPARLGLLLLSRAGKRAGSRRPEARAAVTRELERLRAYEREKTGALDPPADTFAKLLSGLAGGLADPAGRRVLGHLFYHLGRWLYLIDACDDLPSDAKTGAYNPVAARFGLTGGRWTEEAKEAVRDTLCLSRREIDTALPLLPGAAAVPVLENIFILGLPHVEQQVLAGTWRKGRKV